MSRIIGKLRKVIENFNFDYVFHLAAEYGRWNGEAYYENLWQTNVIGTKNLTTSPGETMVLE